jgi:hypothetical protein
MHRLRVDDSVRPRRAIAFAAVGLALFALALAIEHVVQWDLDVRQHQISEYVHGRSGALMTAGFVAWAGSLLATGGAFVRDARLAGRWAAAMLAVAAAGMLVTASFPTETIAGNLPPGAQLTPSGRAHDIGSLAASIAIVCAALLVALKWQTARVQRAASLGIVLVAATLDGALLATGDPAPGLRQRALVAAAIIWQGLTLSELWKDVRDIRP